MHYELLLEVKYLKFLDFVSQSRGAPDNVHAPTPEHLYVVDLYRINRRNLSNYFKSKYSTEY